MTYIPLNNWCINPTHSKDLNIGDFLVDDSTKNGAGEFKGELIQFGTDKFPDWVAVKKYLMDNK